MNYLYRNKFTGKRIVIQANDVYELISKNFDALKNENQWILVMVSG